jgi:SAM-dependent methyltransferase
MLLGEELRLHDGVLEMCGRPAFSSSNLSAGQVRLLELIVLTEYISSEPYVVLWDEPEQHLHPDLVIRAVELLSKRLDQAQLWLATHCLPLVARLEPSSLYIVDKGVVRWSGGEPSEVLDSLIGGGDNAAHIRDFLARPIDLALQRFLWECLRAPAVVDYRDHDPQQGQTFECLRELWEMRRPVRLLDFGAGKGRLAAMLTRVQEGNPVPVEYFAFDPNGVHAERCQAAIAELHPNSIPTEHYFGNEADLFQHLEGNPVDLVVMSNVLHEISPRDWVSTLRDTVRRLLATEGLLIV